MTTYVTQLAGRLAVVLKVGICITTRHTYTYTYTYAYTYTFKKIVTVSLAQILDKYFKQYLLSCRNEVMQS